MLIFLQIGWRGFKIDVNINRVDIFRYIDRFIYRDGISVIVGYIVLIDNNQCTVQIVLTIRRVL